MWSTVATLLLSLAAAASEETPRPAGEASDHAHLNGVGSANIIQFRIGLEY